MAAQTKCSLKSFLKAWGLSPSARAGCDFGQLCALDSEKVVRGVSYLVKAMDRPESHAWGLLRATARPRFQFDISDTTQPCFYLEGAVIDCRAYQSDIDISLVVLGTHSSRSADVF